MNNTVSSTDVTALRKQFNKLTRAPLGWNKESYNQWKRETMPLLRELGISIPVELLDDDVQNISEDGIVPIIMNGRVITTCAEPEPQKPIDRAIEIEKLKEFLNEQLNKLDGYSAD